MDFSEHLLNIYDMPNTTVNDGEKKKQENELCNQDAHRL